MMLGRFRLLLRPACPPCLGRSDAKGLQSAAPARSGEQSRGPGTARNLRARSFQPPRGLNPVLAEGGIDHLDVSGGHRSDAQRRIRASQEANCRRRVSGAEALERVDLQRSAGHESSLVVEYQPILDGGMALDPAQDVARLIWRTMDDTRARPVLVEMILFNSLLDEPLSRLLLSDRVAPTRCYHEAGTSGGADTVHEGHCRDVKDSLTADPLARLVLEHGPDSGMKPPILWQQPRASGEQNAVDVEEDDR